MEPWGVEVRLLGVRRRKERPSATLSAFSQFTERPIPMGQGVESLGGPCTDLRAVGQDPTHL